MSDKKNLACFVGKRILITGGTGCLATALTQRLAALDCKVIRVGRTKEKFVSLEGRAQIEDVVGDVRERVVWEQLIPAVDMVFHFAAQTSTYVANQDAVADLNANVLPMLYLLETCRQQKRRPVILFSGTVTQAGIPSHLPVNESHPDNPATTYDLHKLMAESYLRYYANEGIVRGATLRLANVYGPGPKSSSADRGILNLMIFRALEGQPITVYGKGDQLRDYLYVDDVVEAFLLGAAAIDRTNGRHFVVGSGQGHTILDAMTKVAECVAEKTGTRAPLVHVDPPNPQSPVEARNFVADPRLITRLTGWRPRYSFAEGINRTIEAAL